MRLRPVKCRAMVIRHASDSKDWRILCMEGSISMWGRGGLAQARRWGRCRAPATFKIQARSLRFSMNFAC